MTAHHRIDQLRSFLEEDPKDTFVLFALAQELSRAGEMQDARKMYLELQSLDPEYVGLYFHLAKLESVMGLTEAARSTYQRGIEMARKKSDQHALSELQGAYTAFEELLEESNQT